MSILKSLQSFAGKPNFRTNVFYDFSVVQKAYFYVFESDSNHATFPYKLADKPNALPVQINPDNINIEQTSTPKRFNGVAESLENDTSKRGITMEQPSSSLRLELYFDLYDEHVIRSGGMVGLLNRELDLNISLMNEKLTSLPHLFKYVASNQHALLFRWGEMSFFGHLSDLTCNYTAFSRWGEPLKCRADATLVRDISRITGQEAIENIISSDSSAEKLLSDTKRTATKIGTVLSGISAALR